ncbi:MAG TPA: VTT domain-containing protein [Ktedonobacteraceae bacterium]|nr:VTT domain-containing protein [Ktedonobacteraceae bacterium]
MNNLLPTLLDWLQQVGYPVLWGTVFVAAAGLPLPTVLLLLAAGAFASLGEFNLALLLLMALSASVGGDNLGYWIGRLWGTKALNWLERPHRHLRQRPLISPRIMERSRKEFAQHGGWAVFLSRFLISALGGVINLLAGADLYSYRRFLILDVLGETLGVGIPLILGYAFGASWEAVGDVLGAFSSLILALLLFFALSIYLIRVIHHMRASQKATQEKKSALVEPIVTSQIAPDRKRSGNLPP